MRTLHFVALTLALTAVVAGCASRSTTTSYVPAYPADTASYPAAAPVWTTSPQSPDAPVLVSPNPDAPLAQHSDAAGSASVPGYYSVPPAIVITPDTTR